MAPERTCVGCRAVKADHELVRLVRTAEGALDTGRSIPGRGAWLCAGSPECLRKAKRRGAFRRAFKAELAPGALDDLEALLGSQTSHRSPPASLCEDGEPGP